MNAEETARLLVLVSEFCPQQIFTPADEDHGIPGSAAMWASVLDDVSYRDAALAVKRLVKRQRFVAVSEVIEMVAVIRTERLDAIPEAQRPVPNVDPADVGRYLVARRAIDKAIADGDIRSDGTGGWVLPSTRWQAAIATTPTGERREIDYLQVFSGQRASLRARRQAEEEAERVARDDERRERERQLAALAAYAQARARKLARKRRARTATAKPLIVPVESRTMAEEPRAARDAAAG